MLELLNQVLYIYKYIFTIKKLDGFETNNSIKIIMATNRIDMLDPALLRPGRIDRKVEFPHPSVEVVIFEVYYFYFLYKRQDWKS